MNAIKKVDMLMRGLLVLLLATGLVHTAGAQETVEYIHTDALGSPVATTDAAGNVTERTVYEPYGAVVNRPLKDGPGYGGHVSDAATGLSYMQQRYMDPQVGAFLSADPVTAHEQPINQFSRYRYGNGNPYRFTDPDGRSATAAVPLLIVPIIIATTYYSIPVETRSELGRKFDQTVKGMLQRSEPVNDGPALPDDGSIARDGASGNGAGTGKMVGNLPKPPTGAGKVPQSERDPQRKFSPSARESKRAEQGGQCATGCGTNIDAGNSAGHHVDRHSDGGRTNSENHAEVCRECHADLHAGG